MKCLGGVENTKLCKACALYEKCYNKTKALSQHEDYIQNLYKAFKKTVHAAGSKGNYFTSKQLLDWLIGQIKDKIAKRTIALTILRMAKNDSAFEIKEGRLIPIKK